MSDYMRALERLTRERTQTCAPSRRPPPGPSAVEASAAEPRPRPVPARIEQPHGAVPAGREVSEVAPLFERLRLLATRDGLRAVVLADVVADGAGIAVARALARHAAAYGDAIRVLPLHLADGGQALATADGSRPPLAANATDGSGATLGAWLARHAPEAGLVVFHCPAFTQLPAAGLLAAACDALVIVAEAERTDGAALARAADRARLAGCRTLGVVYVRPDRPRTWLDRLWIDRTRLDRR